MAWLQWQLVLWNNLWAPEQVTALIPQMDAAEIIQLCTEIHPAEEERTARQTPRSLQRLEQQQPATELTAPAPYQGSGILQGLHSTRYTRVIPTPVLPTGHRAPAQDRTLPLLTHRGAEFKEVQRHDHSEGKVGLMAKPTMGNSQGTRTHTWEGTRAAAT